MIVVVLARAGGLPWCHPPKTYRPMPLVVYLTLSAWAPQIAPGTGTVYSVVTVSGFPVQDKSLGDLCAYIAANSDFACSAENPVPAGSVLLTQTTVASDNVPAGIVAFLVGLASPPRDRCAVSPLRHLGLHAVLVHR